jgi:hypothetical protein
MTFISLLAGGLLFAPQQPVSPPKTTASVEGRIVNSVNGGPISHATVLLRSANMPDGSNYAEDSDDNGRFRVDDVAPGEYFLTVQRQGFMLQQPGAHNAPPPRLKVEIGEHVRDVVLRLAPPGVIAGRILDQEGDPVRGASVSAMQYEYVPGKRELRSSRQVQSNDKGEFRLFGLRPGTYYLQASKRNMSPPVPENIRGSRPPSGFSETYYPSVTDAARAVPIEVGAGAQVRGIDVRIRHEAVYRAAFKLPSKDGDEQPGYSLAVTRRGTNNYYVFGGMNRTKDTIECAGLSPGSYAVVVTQFDRNKPNYAYREFDVVDQDIDGGALIFLPPADVSGILRLEGAKPNPFPKFFVNLTTLGPSMWQTPSAEIKQDGPFAVRDVPPSAYRVEVEQQPGLYIKSIQFADRPLSDHRLDVSNGGSGTLLIVLGADVGQIEGSVKKSNGDPAINTRVSALAYGEHLGNLDYSRTVFSDTKGHFLLKSVPPAEYKVFAWEDVENGAPQDPEFRRPFEKQGVTVKLAPNGHESIELTSIVTLAPADR